MLSPSSHSPPKASSCFLRYPTLIHDQLLTSHVLFGLSLRFISVTTSNTTSLVYTTADVRTAMFSRRVRSPKTRTLFNNHSQLHVVKALTMSSSDSSFSSSFSWTGAAAAGAAASVAAGAAAAKASGLARYSLIWRDSKYRVQDKRRR